MICFFTEYQNVRFLGKSIDIIRVTLKICIMKDSDIKLKEELLNEIVNSNMTLKKKMKVLNILDKAFRKYLGIIYLSDEELDELSLFHNRSM